MNPSSSLKPKRRFHPALIVVFILMGIGLLVVCGFAIWRIGLSNQISARLQAIKNSGEPTDVRELDAWYAQVEDKDNAALVWLDGISKLNPKQQKGGGGPWGFFKLPARGVRATPAQLEEANRFVAPNQEALALFKRAARMEKSRYPIDLTQGAFTQMPHLSALKSSSTLLRIEALVLAEKDRAEAAEAVGAILAAGQSLDLEPNLISQLVRYALDTLAASAAERMLSLMPGGEVELASLQKRFQTAGDADSAYRALVGERASFATALNNPQALTPPPPDESDENAQAVMDAKKSFSSPFVRATGFFQRDLRFFLDAMTTNIAQARLPDPERFSKHDEAERMALGARKGYYIMSGLTLPALANAIKSEAGHRALMRAAQAGVAVERYRLANGGRLPASLSALVPKYLDAVPVDPIDGQPLHFKRLPKSFVIYSIGTDGQDDGGKERSSDRNKRDEPHDITFTVERP